MSVKTLGILGGGQLGRMSAQAAQTLGIRTVIFTPETNSPASQVADQTLTAPYDDQGALKEFADQVDVISYEFENIPLETVRYLQNLKPVYPNDVLLEISQDRLKEKKYLNDTGIPTARWLKVESVLDIEKCLKDWQVNDLIIKTTRFGYDGKGQARISTDSNIQNVLKSFENQVLIAEEVIDFKCEISVIAARDQFGNTETYGPALNEHKNHILDKSIAPAPIDQSITNKAIEMTTKLAETVNLVGVLALELFITKSGEILANEIAPRTHNSGHWTVDACEVSQFENHVRTVCSLPVAAPNQHSPATMINLIGNDVNNLSQYKDKPGTHIHLYGKTEAKEGRKMGHVTVIGD